MKAIFSTFTPGFFIAQRPGYDDIKDNRDLLLANLGEIPNFTILEAENGEQAVELTRQYDPDLIVMDIRMPVMDGYQATHEIKQFSDALIIALTASVMVNEFKPLQKEDFDGYLRKPVLKADLVKEISQFLTFDRLGVVVELSPNDIEVDANDIYHLAEALEPLQTLVKRCKQVEKSNNISDISDFAQNVKQLSEQYPVTVIKRFVEDLMTSIDSFDISGIKTHLSSFPLLVEKLSDLSQQQ